MWILSNLNHAYPLIITLHLNIKEDTILTSSLYISKINYFEDQAYTTYRFKLIRTSELCKKQLKISLHIEHAKCKICSNVWNDVVTVAPCLHNFCNGCFSEWSRSQGKDTTALCPQCGAVVHCVGRNQFLHNIESEILESDPSLKRSSEETVLLEPCASTNLDLIVRTGLRTGKRSCKRTGNRTLGWKRPYSPNDDENKAIELPCPQCELLVLNPWHQTRVV
ncbi:zinc finger protein [Macleaya cordata]|uniref:Zinc finger protein n=1 Tax=Macleaya cordata TaxID=56857 RepID=A0A200QDY5_MACCD|nr:zinc finger protein [Macleaya cordata]